MRASSNSKCASISIKAAAPMVIHIANSAVQLQATLHDSLCCLVAEKFYHADFFGDVRPPQPAMKGVVVKLPGRFQSGVHVGNLVADGLESVEGGSECGSSLQVSSGLVERVLRPGNTSKTAEQTFPVQSALNVSKSLPSFTQHGVRRDIAIRQLDLPGGG